MIADPEEGDESELDRPLEVAKVEYDTVQFSRSGDGRVVGAPDNDDGRVVGTADED